MIIESIKFVLDANVFMEASRRYYPLDFAKPFWDGLIQYAAESTICSIDKVFDEINKGNDSLKTWADTDFNNYFIATKNDENIL